MFLKWKQEVNAGFRNLLSKSTQQLKALAKKLGNSIEKSRPYYDACEEYKNAQEKCQEAAVQFQRAFGMLISFLFQDSIKEERFMSSLWFVNLQVSTKLPKRQ